MLYSSARRRVQMVGRVTYQIKQQSKMQTLSQKKIQRLFFILKAKIIITNYVYKNLKI